MGSTKDMSRRKFIAASGTAGAGGLWVGYGSTSAGEVSSKEMERAVTPAEDLMFEHGAIERMLLIYDRLCERIDADGQVPAQLVSKTAGMMRDFGAQYHEKLEEQYIFPRLERAQKHAALVRTLRQQHIVGREITAVLLEATKGSTLKDPKRIARAMRSFSRMYLPHIAMENSVAFRAFHDLVPPALYTELGEQFEDKEQELFGEDGFEKIVAQVSDVEKQLGLADLERSTPKMETLR